MIWILALVALVLIMRKPADMVIMPGDIPQEDMGTVGGSNHVFHDPPQPGGPIVDIGMAGRVPMAPRGSVGTGRLVGVSPSLSIPPYVANAMPAVVLPSMVADSGFMVGATMGRSGIASIAGKIR